ncbi:PQQ-binding-like beta-propeller repeat protein [Wolbachia endosymbiont of Chironomus riparius]|uniref:PQQ-binding-like beta-propeller repeat protein n=1 Tax=Wolbachia endosymbiont of Chironomus riparius TaxID=2883238 RepID=UPI00209E9CF3|nr:PQQ-binding-like beta-propeller repeat protein [Wolbachia endosymbiont of Chironomus riparius]
MRLKIASVIFLFSIHCTFAKDEMEFNKRVKVRYECTSLSEIEKKFSQGYIAPVFVRHIGNIVADGKKVIHYLGKWKNKKLDLSANHEIISKMAITEIHREHFILTIDNVLYMINEIEDEAPEGVVKWKKELKSPIKGSSIDSNNKLAVLTIDNYLYMLDAQNGDVIWSYHNGTSEMIGLHYVSPISTNNMVIAPFSNGELIAFDENGKRLWSYKLPTNFLDTPFTDITTTPKLNNNILIVTNNSSIAALDVKSGNLLWSKPLKVKNMNESIVITADDDVIKIDTLSGKVIWSTKLPIKNNKDIYYSIPVRGGRYDDFFIVTNKGIMFLLNKESGIVEEIVTIPEGVYHHMAFFSPSDDLSTYFTTEKKGVYFCRDTLFG